MRAGETLKAVGLAALILALNLLVTTLAITGVFAVRQPDRSTVFVEVDEAGRIAAWTAPIGGALLFALAIWWFGRRRPERSPWRFALMTWLAYVVIDAASGAAMASAGSVLSIQMAVSMAMALAGALGGAALARSRSLPAEVSP